MTQHILVPTMKSQKEQAVVSAKKQLVKLNFDTDADEKARLSEKIAKKVVSRMNRKREAKIGWFKYYKAAELILTDKHGNKQTFAQHKWAKIPSPKKRRVSKTPGLLRKDSSLSLHFTSGPLFLILLWPLTPPR